ncbi:MAG: hypothetical protein ACLGH8_01285 [Bacteroidia bacterium]
MKRILLSALFLASTYTFAQAPQGISYQAVAFSSTGSPVVNGNIGIKISLLDSSTTGTVLYSETHTKPTNAQGLFNLNIGQGTAVTGTFSAINWGGTAKFVKIEVDPAGGTNYTIVGTNQLMSVPYALYADKVNTGAFAGMGTQVFKKSSFSVIDNDKVLVFSNGNWYTKNCTSSPVPAEVIGSNGNFLVVDNDNIHVFYNGSWITQACTSSPDFTEVFTSEGNFAVIDNDNIHVFANGTWYTKACTSSPVPAELQAGNGNFAVIDNDHVHAFSGTTWYTKDCSSSPVPTELKAANGAFLVLDNNQTHVFNNGTWSTANTESSPVPDEVKISTTE